MRHLNVNPAASNFHQQAKDLETYVDQVIEENETRKRIAAWGVVASLINLVVMFWVGDAYYPANVYTYSILGIMFIRCNPKMRVEM